MILVIPRWMEAIFILAMATVTIAVFIPAQIIEKGAASDFGLRWAINLIDKYDKRNKTRRT